MVATAKPTIIRKVEVTEQSGHHGGAWKVAYADFMTAMMAFFLLLWILSSSDEQKLRGIAEYFTNATMPNGSGLLDGATFGPPGTLNASRGAVVAQGADFGEEDDPSPAKWEVMDITPTADPDQTQPGTNEGLFDNPAGGAPSAVSPHELGTGPRGGTGAMPGSDALKQTAADTAMAKAVAATAAETQQLRAADSAQFDALQAELRQAIQENPDLRPLEQNVIFERTPAGLRIQVVDQQGQPMFNTGSAEMRGATLHLMEKLGDSLATMPNSLVISGHTDAVPFTNRDSYDNWDLSSDRANAMRRVLLQSGVAQSRITRVSGMADTDLLVPEDALDPSNRRITVLLEFREPGKAVPPAAPAREKPTGEAGASAADVITPKQPKAIEVAAPARQTDVVASAQPDRITQLDETVFENLRNALR
ncbi:flagellar motor protein MotB [Antarcticimicrobium sediminis]|uniref:Chemotaxis protein MotB n=1 Tax=Antarcticimicrobium sediminis TaxID=2546227 RepID=A0A4R5EVM0_9RHOB|nr:flagellar motor protein MotB [Antarcticimicrobium sediminis]TDE38870.1 chemotaxis protein MotB [Antarcticimicrobium sediminis]